MQYPSWYQTGDADAGCGCGDTAQSKRGSRRGRAVVGSWRLALWGLWRHGGMGASKQALGAIGWPPAARVIMSYDVIKSVSWMKGDHTGEQDRKGTSYTSTLSGYMMIPTRSNSDTSDNARPPRRSLSLCRPSTSRLLGRENNRESD